MKFDFLSKEDMKQNSIIIFVCEHGAAKSVIAAAYFNKVASETGLGMRAIARGTHPDKELSPQAIKGLSQDGLAPTESVPQRLTQADMQSAQWVVTFCQLPVEYRQQAVVEHWEAIPPVSDSYEQARDVIIERIRQMFDQ